MSKLGRVRRKKLEHRLSDELLLQRAFSFNCSPVAKNSTIKQNEGQKHPTLVLFLVWSHSLRPGYAGFSFEMHHSGIATDELLRCFRCPPLRALLVDLKHYS